MKYVCFPNFSLTTFIFMRAFSSSAPGSVTFVRFVGFFEDLPPLSNIFNHIQFQEIGLGNPIFGHVDVSTWTYIRQPFLLLNTNCY